MAYSNVTPPPLPEYDTETYGFYILIFSYEIGAEDWYSVQLRYAPWRFSYDEALGITNGGNNFLQVYGDGTWGDWGQNQETLAIKPGQVGKTYQRIYTNHNIFDANDEIYMAADTILPPDENRFPIQDFMNGLVMALCGSLIRWPSREPVAYLYNGVRLPKLPEWDKEAYPYAAIVQHNTTGIYKFYADAEAFVIGTDGGLTELWPDVVYSLEDGTWVEQTSGGLNYATIWSNTDLYYSQENESLAGTLAFFASEPVPVYE